MIIIPATIESIRTRKDRTISVTIGTQELTPDKGAELMRLSGKLGYIAIKEADFQPEEVDALEEVGEELQKSGKTRSQRLRSVLFILYNQDSKGFQNFQDYYANQMETLITHLKSKING